MEAERPGPQAVVLRLLGPPELSIAGATVTIERRKALALLAYLAVEQRDHAREELATLLAPDDEPATARAGLRRALAELTPTIRPWLVATGSTLALRRDQAFVLDLDAFRAGLAGPVEALQAAVERYRGDFMAGFSLSGSPALEEWQFFQAEALRGELAAALDRLSDPELAADKLDAAIVYARRWLALDPLHEPAHLRLMQLYAAAGQRAAALRQHRVLSETLARELGAAPGAATRALYEQIRQGDRNGQASRWSIAPLRRPVTPPPTNPTVETPALPFLGREEELARVAAALADPACRILTLVGPGGMGKTRLGVHAATQHQARFPDGVSQISLVGVSTAERLLSTIGAALGLAAQGDPLERLGAALHDRHALLVLDNADQTLEGAPLLRDLIHRTRQLKLLVTSRERLQLQEEWVVDLAGLAVPPADSDADATGYSAVQLFVQRARQVRADFALTAEDLPAVVAICRLVEGMPLAIELAAAWVRVLTPAAIANELAQSMALLTTTLRDVPERHRSIEGVFAQSWERLSQAERQALSQLSVFDDGFTRVAASEVAGATPLMLAGLTDKALIRRDRTGRYAIHELLRQFAAHKLAADPVDAQATALRFCRFCLRQLEQASLDLQGNHQRQTLAELELEYDNLWKAWSWTVDEQGLADLDAALDGLYRLHELRGWYTDGIQALELLLKALAEGQTAAALLVARARARLGALHIWVGQFAAAERELNAALPVLQAHAAALDIAFTLTNLGLVANERDESETARRRLDEGLAAYRALDHQPGIAWVIDALGDLAGSLGEYERARELLDASSAMFSALGDEASAAWSLSSLGRVLSLMGDHASARQLLEESIVIFASLGDEHGCANSHANLGEIAYGARDLDTARSHWLAALRLAREVGALPLILDALVGVAQIFSERAAPERAHELAALALAHPASWQETLSAAQAVMALTGAALSDQSATQAARRGRTTPWETAALRLLAEDAA